MEKRDMKTVVMIDRSSKFLDKCNDIFEIVYKEKPKPKKMEVDKTIWSWCLEGVFEMHRVLNDVYPMSSISLRFAVSDFMGKMLDTEWKSSLLTREELVEVIKEVKTPSPDLTDITPIGGLTMAIEALSVETPEQRDYNYERLYSEENRTPVNSEVLRVERETNSLEPIPVKENKGNLVIFTRFKTEEEMVKLKEEIVGVVLSRNRIASSPSNKTYAPHYFSEVSIELRFCALTSLRVFIVNYYAVGETCTVKTHPLEERPELPLLEMWTVSRKAPDMEDAVHSLLVSAFDMGSTTVTKIPMKEDNRGSTRFDVELFHSANMHQMLIEQKLIDIESPNARSDSGVTYNTMRLAWTTAPKTKWSLFPYYGNAVPCTTSESYSRPSACLTAFVKDGRCVMLDLEESLKATCGYKRNMPDKVVTHLLVSNGGRIFIQEIDFVQEGDKVYRKVGTSKEFRDTEKPVDSINFEQLEHVYSQMELQIVGKNFLKTEKTDKQKEKWAKLKHMDIEKRFEQISRNIPMFSADTFIFHEVVRPELEPLISTITKPTLKETDFDKCKAKIMKLLEMRTMNEMIISPDADIDECLVECLDDPEEQMRVSLVELAKHMMKYVNYSEMHEKIFKTFMTTLDVDKLLEVDVEDPYAENKKFVKFPFFQRAESTSDVNKEKLHPLERFLKRVRETNVEEEEEKDNEGEKGFLIEEKKPKTEELVVQDVKLVIAKEVKIDIFATMCDMLERNEAAIGREFVGRAEHGNKAPLYPQLAEQQAPSSTAPSVPIPAERTDRVKNADRGGSGTPPPARRPF